MKNSTFKKAQTKHAFFAIALCAMGSMPLSALAENIAKGSCGTNVKWSLDDETLTISGEGEMNDFTNPTYASATTPSWTPYKKYIKHLVVKDGVTKIGDFAFYDYEELEDIQFGNTIKKLGDQAFVKCFSLTQLNLPESLEQIGTPWTNYSQYGFTFQNCSGIKELTLPANLKYIAASSFSGCAQLEKLYWNAKDCDADGISNYEIFGRCPIKEVDFGPDVITLPARAFYNNGSVESIKTHGTIRYVGVDALTSTTWLGLQDKGMVYLDHAAYIYKMNTDNPEPIKLELKEGTTSITTRAFIDNKYLVKISIPRTVDRMGSLTFDGCSSLSEVVWNADSVNIEDDFYHGYHCAPFSASVSQFTFGDHVRYLPAELLSKCSGLSEIKLPESLEYIGKDAFRECDGITELTIPDKVSYIGETALYGMKNVKTISIGKGVKDINSCYIFGQCPNLKTIYWNAVRVNPPSGSWYSNYCQAAVETVHFGDDVEYVPSIIFRQVPTLTQVTLGKNVREIGEEAFRGDTGLKGIDLPETLETIGDYAFCESGLESLFIPAKVKNLGTWGLGTKDMKQVIMATNEVPVGSSSFIDCGKDMKLYVPDVQKYKASIYLDQYGLQMQPMVKADTAKFELEEGKLPQPVFTSNIPGYTLTHIDLSQLEGTNGDHHADLEATFEGTRNFTVKIGYDYTIKTIDTGIQDILMGDADALGKLSSARRGIFDLEGRKLAKEPARGIYIKDGKKVAK